MAPAPVPIATASPNPILGTEGKVELASGHDIVPVARWCGGMLREWSFLTKTQIALDQEQTSVVREFGSFVSNADIVRQAISRLKF